MSEINFTHLHLHTEYSLLDGANKIGKLAKKLKSQGVKAVAITDHGNMFMAYDLYKACKKHGLKPIYGNETYIAPGSNLIKEKIEGEKPAYHLILLAENQEFW